MGQGATQQRIGSIRGVVSTLNSSTVALGANEEFVGTSEEVVDFAILSVFVFASHASATDGLVLEYSSDGTNWDDSDKYTIVASKGRYFTVPAEGRYFRVRFKNGATLQTAFRLQTLFRYVYAKPTSHRLVTSITDEEDAELVRAILSARKIDGSGYVNIEATEDNRLLTSSAVAAPIGATAVNRLVDGDLGANGSSEDVYTITNAKTLRIQRFTGGGENSVSGGRVELYERAGNPAVDTLIDVGYISGGNFQFDLSKSLVGDTSPSVNRRVVLKRINGGGSTMRIKGRWEGYEE